MTNTITRLQALITQAEAQTDKLPIVSLHDEDIQALRDAVRIVEQHKKSSRVKRYFKKSDNPPFVVGGELDSFCDCNLIIKEHEYPDLSDYYPTIFNAALWVFYIQEGIEPMPPVSELKESIKLADKMRGKVLLRDVYPIHQAAKEYLNRMENPKKAK